MQKDINIVEKWNENNIYHKLSISFIKQKGRTSLKVHTIYHNQMIFFMGPINLQSG